MFDPTQLPADLPVPVDDGAASHLAGLRLPDIPLRATSGIDVSLARLTGRVILYAYPKTGLPGREMPPGWDLIPGARGCTPQSCGFRDHFAELRQLGADHVFGLSTQDTAYQNEMVQRLHLPFSVLSDETLGFIRAIALPTFEVAGEILLKRLALVIDQGSVTQVFYPVFPPNRNAEDVVEWLRNNPRCNPPGPERDGYSASSSSPGPCRMP
jgi:peroxiredoxin